MTTTCDTDPNTQTIAAAWASSPLGQPDGEVRSGFATAGPTEPVTARADERSAKRVMVATGLACGIGAGALLGVMLFTSSDSSQPAVVVPAPAPQHAVVVSSSTAGPAPKHVVAEQSTAPTAVAPAPRSGPSVAASPTPPAAQPPVAIPPISTPPVASPGDTTVVVNIPIPDYPPLPPKPEDPDPEPPKPPVLDDPSIKQPEPPKPEPPKPEPPTFVPDLPLSPKLPKPPIVVDPPIGP
jgi:hypothetical protein